AVLALPSARVPAGVERGLHAMVIDQGGHPAIEIHDGAERVGLAPEASPCGVDLQREGGPSTALRFGLPRRQGTRLEFPPLHVGALEVRLAIDHKAPNLIERSLEVSAAEAARFALKFSFFPAVSGRYASFTGPEEATLLYDTIGGGPEYPGVKGQTF